MRVTSRRFRRYSQRIQRSMGDVTRVAKEALEGQRVIKIFNAQDKEQALFEVANEHNRASYMKLITVKAVSNPVVQMIAALGLAAVMYMAIRRCSSKGVSIGEFTSFLTALLLITAPLRRLVEYRRRRCSRASRPARASSRSSTPRPKARAVPGPLGAPAARSNSGTCRSSMPPRKAMCCGT